MNVISDYYLQRSHTISYVCMYGFHVGHKIKCCCSVYHVAALMLLFCKLKCSVDYSIRQKEGTETLHRSEMLGRAEA